MSARYFLDTNVLVYSFDDRNPKKQQKARKLIEAALADDSGFISAQVIQEFLNVALKKFEKPLSIHEARTYLEQVLTPLCDVYPNAELYSMALDIKGKTHIGFYDALIVASATTGGAKTLYTEDLQDVQRIDGLTVRNPF